MSCFPDANNAESSPDRHGITPSVEAASFADMVQPEQVFIPDESVKQDVV